MSTTRSHPGELKILLRGLTEDLDVRIAFICEPCKDQAGHAQTVALCFDGDILENRTYPLEGTPCQRVYDRGVTYHSHDVARLYPDDAELVEWGMDTYLGVAIVDEAGRRLGHVGVMNDKAFGDPAGVERKVRALAMELATKF